MSHFGQHIQNYVRLFLCLACLLHGEQELFVLIQEQSEQTIIGAANGVIVAGGGGIVIPCNGGDIERFSVEIRDRNAKNFGQSFKSSGLDIFGTQPYMHVLRRYSKFISDICFRESELFELRFEVY